LKRALDFPCDEHVWDGLQSDRLGRSLIDLLGTIEHPEAAGVDLYLDQQNIDTTTPMGKLLFQITGGIR
jgi:DNA invertase Pin-like site-specific DNA recombinase